MRASEEFDGLDAAALHPQLKHALAPQVEQVQAAHYFQACASLREDVKAGLRKALGLEHELFVLHNTTSGLLSALLALARMGLRMTRRGERRQHYPPYLPLLPEANTDALTEGPRVTFVTHVSPLTGRVETLEKAPGEVLWVDAAQSLGTNLTEEMSRQADLFIAPLHKHVGLAVGAGLVGLRRGIPGEEELRAIFSLAEGGSAHVGLLKALLDALRSAQGLVYNKARLSLDERFQSLCTEARLMPLGSLESGVPFVCLTSSNGQPLEKLVNPKKAHARYFKAENILRLSFCHMARRQDPPVDFSEELVRRMATLVNRNGHGDEQQ
ncbi:DUF6024 family protein [Cystobacter fuscus]|uniref:DUF6024 family protein n=1 Tax=Cystobacter fuscus TaxID=43 RepID=UPI002B307B87|nr:hypothetical protein F0U63_26030 [Cystobacter fuscus]